MDVTRENFKEVLPTIKKNIDECTFVSIDCELTGLYPGARISNFDTPKSYFEKIKKYAQNYTIIQFGLCIFRHDEANEVYKQSCYNFYVFPRQYDRSTPDRSFLCQPSSIEFLIGNEFDFNKLFKEGISYLNKDQESKQLEILLEKQKMRDNVNTPGQKATRENIPIPQDDKEFIDKNMEQIAEFLKTDSEEFPLLKCNAFQRRLMYQSVEEKYSNEVSLETRIQPNKDRILYVVKSSAEKKALALQKKSEQEISDLQDAVGFANVVQYIAESGKLVVGHNLLLDIIHTIDKFMTAAPSEYEEFKECCHCLFPRIIDTKFMASIFPIKEKISNSILDLMLERVKTEPFEIPKMEIDTENGDCGYSLEDEKKLHNAGYDAFITGVCFLAMSQYLRTLENSEDVLRPFLNKIFIMKVDDCPYINLAGKDLEPPRDQVLHATFPRTWRTPDLLQLFSAFGDPYIGWINDTSAYISLGTKEKAEKALACLQHCTMCSIVSYAQHTAMNAAFSKMNSSSSVFKMENSEESSKRKSSDHKMSTTVLKKPDVDEPSSTINSSPFVSKKKENAGETRKRKSSNNEITAKKICNLTETISTKKNVLKKLEKKQTVIPKILEEKAKSGLFTEDSTWD